MNPYKEVLTVMRASNGYVLVDKTVAMSNDEIIVTVHKDAGSLIRECVNALDAMEKPPVTGKMTEEELGKVGWPTNVLKLDRPRGPFPTDEHPERA